MKNSTIDFEDPRLTAYVLGELEGDDRAAFEALLERDAGARAEVDNLRRTTRMITAELAHEPALELEPAQRRSLAERAAGRARPPARSFILGWGKTMVMLGALGFVVMVPLLGLMTSSRMEIGSRRAPGAYELAMARAERRREPEDQRLPARLESGHEATSVEQSAAGNDYRRIVENDFQPAAGEPRSTFSIDVDTASYAIVRRYLEQHTRPPRDAVRIEELVNYFPYEYPEPDAGEPLTVLAETTSCPWKPEHRLVRIGLKGRSLTAATRPRSNLVFLIDVSGSMSPPDRLPLLVQSLRLLVGELTENDSIAIVVYAGASGLVLPPTSGADKTTILNALDSLQAGGSTNGSAGIELAYQTAVSNFIKGGTNRVILATDGDFNLGVTAHGDLERLIEEKRQTGVFLSVLGVGMGNHQDSTMESLSKHGNGNYAYIDSLAEARKVLVEQAGGTLVTVAKDVKVQVEFNPAQVASWRLVGYEHRLLAAADFNDDKKDAGELGAGHTVTALYEVVPAMAATPRGAQVDPLKYQPAQPAKGAAAAELLTVKVRHQKPAGGPSALLSFPVVDRGGRFEQASEDTRFAAAVAAFGMLLRESEHRGSLTFDGVAQIAQGALGRDRGGYRKGFLELVERARGLVQ